jgi:4-hydroxybenzoyl-CoA thioesterase
MVEHTTSVQVRWSDADPAGIVFYPRFFEWFDMGTEALFKSVGLAWPDAFPTYDVVGVPIVESSSRFIAPVRYGDVVTIRTRVAWVRPKVFRVEHDVSVGDTLCASGFEVRAWVGKPETPSARLHARPMPAVVAAKLRGEEPPAGGRGDEGAANDRGPGVAAKLRGDEPPR